MILLLVGLFLGSIPSVAVSASPKPKINCLIINLEYVNCTWSEPELKNNYSFKSRFVHDEPLDCPAYHRINGVNVGCKFPYGVSQRFLTLHTWLYSENGSLVAEQSDPMKEIVKLSPPSNLTVVARKDTELWLYWNVTNHRNKDCIESEVHHRTDNKDWKNPNRATRTSFSLPFPSTKCYEFQVRARIADSCGQSKFWSDWSKSVYWGCSNNSTVIWDPKSVTSLLMYTFGATILLVFLSCLLVHSERLRIILIPVVPNAGRNVGQYLTSLFDNYDDGNIEKWLSMPKDLENGFKPNFTERACPVREYRLMSQSSSDSESILSNPTEQSSDYQCMHSYSSASTIPGPAEDLPTQDPPPVDNPV